MPPKTPLKERETASPPSPLRMERGVNTIVCKQRGRSFALKGAFLHIEERLSLHERNALFICTPAIPANELLPRNTPTDVL